MQTIGRFKTAWNFFKYLDDETFFGGGLDITNRCNLHCYTLLLVATEKEHRPER